MFRCELKYPFAGGFWIFLFIHLLLRVCVWCVADLLTVLNSENTTIKGTPGKLDPGEVDLPPGEDLPPAPIEQDIDEWVFLDRDKLESDKSAVRLLSGMSSLHIDLKLDA